MIDCTSDLDVITSSLGETLLPLRVSPARGGLDLAGWLGTHRPLIDDWLGRHGAIVCSGFGLDSPDAFKACASALVPDLYAEYGDLPRQNQIPGIYQSTPYPPDQAILFHNEASHTDRWPRKQMFFCVEPAAVGGATPLVDCRRVLGGLPAGLAQQFVARGLMYVRNFVPGLDVPWQSFFGTDDRARVEALCAARGISCEWVDDEQLRTRYVTRAVLTHPRTGEASFFNQVQLHHASCLPPDVREGLGQLFGDEGLPRNVLWGDGTPIEDAVIDAVGAVYEREAIRFPWAAGDLVLLDNLLVAHGRDTYQGPRTILVAMGEMMTAADL